MKSKNLLLKKATNFHNDVSEKRDINQVMCLQTNQEFYKTKLKNRIQNLTCRYLLLESEVKKHSLPNKK